MSENIKNGRGNSLRQAMIDQGYSESYADRAGVNKTDAWQELIEERFPDEYLAGHHDQLLNSVKIAYQVFPAKMEDKEIKDVIESFGFQLMKIKKNESWKRAYYPIINDRAKKAALDMMYKLKRKYDTSININAKFSRLSDEDIEREIAGILQEAIEFAGGEEEEAGE